MLHKGDKALKIRSAVAGHQKVTATSLEHHWRWSLTTIREVAEEVRVSQSVVIRHLKQIGKLKKLNTWLPHELTKNFKKNHHFEVSSSLILCNNNKPFLNWIVNVWQKWIVYDNQRRPTQGLDWEDAPKRFPESALYQGKVTVTLVVCRQSDPPQLSESQRNHCSWEVCSANQWDTPKTSTPAAGIGQQKGSDSSPRQCLTTRCTTSASEVGQIGLRSSAPSAVFAWPLTNKLPLLQASRQLFAGKTFLQPGCRKMLSKSSSNSEAQIFTL